MKKVLVLILSVLCLSCLAFGLTACGAKGDKGEDGVSISEVFINDNDELVIILSDGTINNLGIVKGDKGNDGVSISKVMLNENNELIIVLSNGTATNLGVIKGDKGERGNDGISISKVYLNEDDELIIVLSNGTTTNLGIIKGEKGEKGDNGDNGLSAYELYKKYHPEYIGNEEEFMYDLVNGKLGKIENQQELTFYLKDDKTYAVSVGGAKYLSKIEIPSTYKNKTVTSIIDNGFEACAVKEIIIPDTVTEIGSHAFYNCTNLINVTISKNLIKINDNAFSNCPIEIATIPSIACKSVANSSLKEVNITAGETIVKQAFHDCKLLAKITISDTITTIEEDAFTYLNTENLKRSVYITDIKKWCEIDFQSAYSNPLMLGYDDDTEIISNLYLNNVLVTNLEIPETITEVKQYAFICCTSIKKVTLSNTVLSVGSCSFAYCTSLVDIKLSNILTTIGNSAFYSSMLVNLQLPNSVESISERAFYNCISLLSVTIGNNLKNVDSEAFYGCYKLVEIINLSNLTITKGSTENGYIAYYAINVKTDGITDIVNENNLLFYTKNWDNYLLGYIGENTEVILPDDYHGYAYQIYKYALYCNRDIENLTISDGVTLIDEYSFANCFALKEVTIGNCIKSIGTNAFDNCPIEIATIPTMAISSIEKTNLTSVTITSGESIDNNAFYECKTLKYVTIGDEVKSIGNYAFYNCTSLSSIEIPNNVTSIGYAAFYNCKSLSSITIGSSVTSIGNYAFEDCTSLSSITYDGTMTEWNKVSKGSYWKNNIIATVVHCSDGDAKI